MPPRKYRNNNQHNEDNNETTLSINDNNNNNNNNETQPNIKRPRRIIRGRRSKTTLIHSSISLPQTSSTPPPPPIKKKNLKRNLTTNCINDKKEKEEPQEELLIQKTRYSVRLQEKKLLKQSLEEFEQNNLNEIEKKNENENNINHSRKRRRLNNNITTTLVTEVIEETQLESNENNNNDQKHENYDLSIYECPMSMTGLRQCNNQWKCKYQFGKKNGWNITIDSMLGHKSEAKMAINILSQELTPKRVKITLERLKNAYLIWINNEKNIMYGAGMFIIDKHQKRLNIELLAVDRKMRGNKLGEMMIRLFQYKIAHIYPTYKLFVCAANEAMPFWTKTKYHFTYADKKELYEYELNDEKKGGTTHLKWIGNPNDTDRLLYDLFVHFKR